LEVMTAFMDVDVIALSGSTNRIERPVT